MEKHTLHKGNSMRILASTMVAGFMFSFATGHAQLVATEGFDTYTNGALVGQGGWAQFGSQASSAALADGSLVYKGYNEDASGKSVLLNEDAVNDVSKTFVLTPSSSDALYYAVLVNFQKAPTASNYFMTVSQSDTDIMKLYAMPGSGDKVKLGVAGSSAASMQAATQELSLNSTNLVVLKATMSGDKEGQAELFINPTDFATAPTESDATTLKALALTDTRAAAEGFVKVDDLRIASEWAELFDVETAGVESEVIAPVQVSVQGKTIYINAESLQGVEAWSLTGAQLASQACVDGAATLDVDYSGIVVLKITTDTAVVAKKVVIK